MVVISFSYCMTIISMELEYSEEKIKSESKIVESSKAFLHTTIASALLFNAVT